VHDGPAGHAAYPNDITRPGTRARRQRDCCLMRLVSSVTWL
jgi:hypothetical protein